MRLRYLREQKDQMRQTKVTKKRAKYNLDDLYSDGEDNHLGGFTHGGRPLNNIDDFQDAIPVSSDDEGEGDADQQQGKLNEEMVLSMNFGGGQFNGKREPTYEKEKVEPHKTRKEVFEEIIAKSKAYKMAKFEVKEAASELTTRLDNQFFDILQLLNMSKVRNRDLPEGPVELDSYEQIAAKLKE